MLKLRKEFSVQKQVIPGDAVPMWYGVAWVEPISGKAICYPFGVHIAVRWAKLLYYALMAPRRTWWELRFREVRDEGFWAGVKVARANPNPPDGKTVFSKSQLRRITAQESGKASQERYLAMRDRTKEIRTRHGDADRPWWPTYREDPEWGPTPDGLTERDALDAVMDALNQEGVDAWSGDATSICGQMLHLQYTKRKEAEANFYQALSREAARDVVILEAGLEVEETWDNNEPIQDDPPPLPDPPEPSSAIGSKRPGDARRPNN